jgi:hypothetical protein
MWQEYAGNMGRLFKITWRPQLHFFDQRENEINHHKATSSPEA